MTRLLLEWVVTASLLILAVAALRGLLGKRISAGLKYALWAVVLVRLLVPVQFFSLPVPAVPELNQEPSVPSVSAAPVVSFPAVQGEPVGVPAIVAPAPSGVAVNDSTPIEPNAVTLDTTLLWDVLCWLWLAGALVMAAAFLISNLSFALRLRRVRRPLEGTDCSLPVYIADGLPSPCLFGLFRPAVYVTAETAQDPAMLRHILAHEYTHFRHGDHVWNVLRSAALAVHWWNPLVWLAVVLSRRDCELACDEGALKRLGDNERIAYGRTLLVLITVKPRPGDLLRCSTTMTGGQKSVFDRVTRIAKAPKRWLWAAVAAVIAASLACVCAFGQAEEPPGPDPWDPSSVTANLTFSLETDSDGDPCVRMDGFVDGVELTRGAFWHPDWWHGDYYEAELTLMYPPFTDGIEGHIEAAWEGGPGSEVSISTRPTTLFSSYMPAGWWVFTVDLARGEVTYMEPSASDGPLADKEVRLYPASISDEEAVRAARIAAKLLTAAEDYYNNYTEDVPCLYTTLLEGASFYSVDAEKSLTFDTIAEALDPYGEGYEITRYTSVDFDGDGVQELVLYVKQQGESYLIFHEMDGELYSYLCGTKVMPGIKQDGTVWDNYVYPPEGDGQGWGYSKVSFTKIGMELHPFTYDITLPSREDGTDNNYRLVVDGQPADDQTYAAAEAALEAKPDVVWHKFPKQEPAPTQPATPAIDPSSYTFTMDEYGVSVYITGLDCESACWYPSRTDRNNGGMKEPSLGISKPRFLGNAFADVYSGVDVEFQDEQLRMQVIENNPSSLGSRDFLVDLTTGTVTEQEISLPEWRGKLPVPPDKVLADAALTLAQLSQAASDFYQASLPAPEEGPLPFDVPMKLMFCSGAGAWDTLLTLHPDGSFEGDYHDMDMGDTGPGYRSTEYVCRFHGRFGGIEQATDASWALTLEELVIDTGHPIGEEWIEDVKTTEGGTYNLRYISSAPYGFDKKGGEGPLEPGAQFMFYTPEATGYRPTDELYGMYMNNPDTDSIMYQFRGWMPPTGKIGAWGPDTRLGCYGLCNMETGCGFFDLKAWGIA